MIMAHMVPVAGGMPCGRSRRPDWRTATIFFLIGPPGAG
jgi:hypothetical protein